MILYTTLNITIPLASETCKAYYYMQGVICPTTCRFRDHILRENVAGPCRNRADKSFGLFCVLQILNGSSRVECKLYDHNYKNNGDSSRGMDRVITTSKEPPTIRSGDGGRREGQIQSEKEDMKNFRTASLGCLFGFCMYVQTDYLIQK